MAEIKKGTVKNITPAIESFDYNGKKFYRHLIIFDDNTTGIAVTITNDGAPWTIGEQVEYEIEIDTKSGGNKIKRLASQQNKSRRNINFECASVALTCAVDLVCDKVLSDKQLLQAAEQFYEWLLNKSEQ